MTGASQTQLNIFACAQGALSMKAWNGVFVNTVMLEFWTYVGEHHSVRSPAPPI